MNLEPLPGHIFKWLSANLEIIKSLAHLSKIELADFAPKDSVQFVFGEITGALVLGDVIDFAKERTRLEMGLKRARDDIARYDARLSNEQFVVKAPKEVLAEQREKRARAVVLVQKLTEVITRLN